METATRATEPLMMEELAEEAPNKHPPRRSNSHRTKALQQTARRPHSSRDLLAMPDNGRRLQLLSRQKSLSQSVMICREGSRRHIRKLSGGESIPVVSSPTSPENRKSGNTAQVESEEDEFCETSPETTNQYIDVGDKSKGERGRSGDEHEHIPVRELSQERSQNQNLRDVTSLERKSDKRQTASKEVRKLKIDADLSGDITANEGNYAAIKSPERKSSNKGRTPSRENSRRKISTGFNENELGSDHESSPRKHQKDKLPDKRLPSRENNSRKTISKQENKERILSGEGELRVMLLDLIQAVKTTNRDTQEITSQAGQPLVKEILRFHKERISICSNCKRSSEGRKDGESNDVPDPEQLSEMQLEAEIANTQRKIDDLAKWQCHLLTFRKHNQPRTSSNENSKKKNEEVLESRPGDLSKGRKLNSVHKETAPNKETAPKKGSIKRRELSRAKSSSHLLVSSSPYSSLAAKALATPRRTTSKLTIERQRQRNSGNEQNHHQSSAQLSPKNEDNQKDISLPSYDKIVVKCLDADGAPQILDMDALNQQLTTFSSISTNEPQTPKRNLLKKSFSQWDIAPLTAPVKKGILGYKKPKGGTVLIGQAQGGDVPPSPAASKVKQSTIKGQNFESENSEGTRTPGQQKLKKSAFAKFDAPMTAPVKKSFLNMVINRKNKGSLFSDSEEEQEKDAKPNQSAAPLPDPENFLKESFGEKTVFGGHSSSRYDTFDTPRRAARPRGSSLEPRDLRAMSADIISPQQQNRPRGSSLEPKNKPSWKQIFGQGNRQSDRQQMTKQSRVDGSGNDSDNESSEPDPVDTDLDIDDSVKDTDCESSGSDEGENHRRGSKTHGHKESRRSGEKAKENRRLRKKERRPTRGRPGRRRDGLDINNSTGRSPMPEAKKKPRNWDRHRRSSVERLKSGPFHDDMLLKSISQLPDDPHYKVRPDLKEQWQRQDRIEQIRGKAEVIKKQRKKASSEDD